ncbi:MAG TPA: cycloartenol synthase, partial [Bacteroidia bacterium]|nr:cycloartenol synthase [Bacteroidia bacterium]
MKPSATLAALSAAIVLPLAAQEKLAPGPDGANVSLKLEIERALEQGAAFLKAQQDKGTGSWGNPENPAFTALAVSALVGDPALADAGKLPDEAGKGYGFLLVSVQPDGGIYRKGLATYNTALSVVAL